MRLECTKRWPITAFSLYKDKEREICRDGFWSRTHHYRRGNSRVCVFGMGHIRASEITANGERGDGQELGDTRGGGREIAVGIGISHRRASVEVSVDFSDIGVDRHSCCGSLGSNG